MTVYMTVLGPLARLDMGPLDMAMAKNGSGFAPAMGLDGAVWRPGSE